MSISSRIRGVVAKAKALAGTPWGQQVGRFVRLAAVTAATAWVGGGHVLSTSAIWGAVVGGVEVAYRSWRQTVGVGEASVPVPAPDPVSPPVLSSVPVEDPAAPAASEDAAPVDPSQGL